YSQILSTFKFTDTKIDLSDSSLYQQPFSDHSQYGYYGTLTLTGYLNIIDKYCGEETHETCDIKGNYKYAYFEFSKSTSDSIYKYLGIEDSLGYRIGMGCYDPAKAQISSYSR